MLQNPCRCKGGFRQSSNKDVIETQYFHLLLVVSSGLRQLQVKAHPTQYDSEAANTSCAQTRHPGQGQFGSTKRIQKLTHRTRS